MAGPSLMHKEMGHIGHTYVGLDVHKDRSRSRSRGGKRGKCASTERSRTRRLSAALKMLAAKLGRGGANYGSVTRPVPAAQYLAVRIPVDRDH